MQMTGKQKQLPAYAAATTGVTAALAQGVAKRLLLLYLALRSLQRSCVEARVVEVVLERNQSDPQGAEYQDLWFSPSSRTRCSASRPAQIQDARHLRKGYLRALIQFFFAEAPDWMENFGEWIAMHAKGLRGHTRGTGKGCGADYCRCLAALLDHDSIVHTARATGPSIANADQHAITFRHHFFEQRARGGPVRARFAIRTDLEIGVLLV